MAKYCSQKSRLTSVVATTETTIAPPTAGHYTQRPLPHINLDRRECKSAPCFAKTCSRFFFAKSRYRDDNHGTGADFVNVLPFSPRRTRVKNTTINREGRGKQKVSVYCLFTALTHLLQP